MLNKVIIPIIRNVMPTLIAQQIVGVQPMSVGAGSVFTMAGNKVAFKNYIMAPNQNECIQYDTPECTYYAVDVRPEVSAWIIEQPIYMWKHAAETEDCSPNFDRYIISEGLLAWITLQWG
jgi:hypothetical protein